MSSNQSSIVMTSPVFRYAVLVVLSVVVVMGAGICYRTRVYQQRMHIMASNAPRHVGPTMAHEWGPKPGFFDVYLDMPKEKPKSDWEEMMPISVARGALDASGASSLPRISIMISMPFSGTFEPLGDDERYPPHVEFGLSDIAVSLDANARRFDRVSDEEKKES